MINCKLCHNQYHVITWMHLLFKHKMSVQAYLRLYGGPIMSEEHKAKAYRYHSLTMKRLYFEGEVNPPVPTPEFRNKQSQRMTVSNPMKNRQTARKVSRTKKGITEKELLERRFQREQEKEETRINREKVGVRKYSGR